MRREDVIKGTHTVCQETNRAHIELTLKCNNRCKFCLQGHFPDETHRTLNEIKKDIDNAYNGRVPKIILSGGEPTIHPDYIDIVKYCKTKKFQTIQTISNGRMFSVEEFAKRTKEAGIDEVTLSLHGATAKTHDELVMVKGAFNQLMKAAKNLRKLGIRVSFDVGIFEENYKELPDIIRLIHDKLGFRCDIDLIGCKLTGNAIENIKDIAPNYNHASKYISEALKLIYEKKIVGWVLRTPLRSLEGYEFYKQDDEKNVEIAQMIVTKDSALPVCYNELENHRMCEYCELEHICKNIDSYYKEIVHDKRRKIKLIVEEEKRNNTERILETHKNMMEEVIIKNNLEGIQGEAWTLIKKEKIVLKDIEDIKKAEEKLKTQLDEKALKEIIWSFSYADFNEDISSSLGIFPKVVDEQKNKICSLENKKMTIYITTMSKRNIEQILQHMKEMGFKEFHFTIKNPYHLIKRELSWEHGVFIRDPTNLVVTGNLDSTFSLIFSKLERKQVKIQDIPPCYFSDEFLDENKDLFENRSMKTNFSTSSFDEKGKLELERYTQWMYDKNHMEDFADCLECKYKTMCEGDYSKSIMLRSFNKIKNK